MEEILNKIGLPSKYAESLEDNYIFTEEDLKIIDKDDATDIFKPDDLKKLFEWQKGGSSAAETTSPKGEKSKKNKNGKTADSSKPAPEIKLKNEKIEESTPENEKREKHTPKFAKNADVVEPSPINTKTDVSDLTPAPSIKPEKGTNDKTAGETKSYENLSPDQIVEILRSETSAQPTEQTIPATKHLRFPCDFKKWREQSKKDDMPSELQFDEVYENQIYRNKNWAKADMADKWPLYSDFSAKKKLDIGNINDLKLLGSNGARWRWLSGWLADGTDSSSPEGWAYSGDKADPADFRAAAQKSDVYRRRRMVRVRTLDKPPLFETDNIAYEILRELIIEILVQFGYTYLNNKDGIRDPEEFIDYFRDLNEIIQLTKFEKDIFFLMNTPQKAGNRFEDSADIFKRLGALKSSEIGKKQSLQKFEELFEKITCYRSSFKGDEILLIRTVAYLVKDIEDAATKANDSFLEAIARRYKTNKMDHLSDKIDFNPLRSVKKAVLKLNDCVCNRSKALEGESLAVVRNECLELFGKLKTTVNDFHDLEDFSIAESVSECFKIIYILSETCKKLSPSLRFSPANFAKSTISLSFRHFYQKKRLLFPKSIDEFYVDEWGEFGKLVKEILINEEQFYVAWLSAPGVLDKPADLTISYLISEFIYEINGFLATVLSSSLSQKSVTDTFHYYIFVKGYLNRAETAKLMSAGKIQHLNKLFLDFEQIFEKSIGEVMSDGFRALDEDILDISFELEDLSPYKDQNKMFPSCTKYINHAKSLIEKVTACFETYILTQAQILKHMAAISAELGARFEKVAAAIFSPQRLKKKTILEFFETEVSASGLNRKLSVAKMSDLVGYLEISAQTKELEKAENVEKDQRPLQKANKGSQLSDVTLKLCILYNNIFNIMQSANDCKSDLNYVVEILVKAGKLSLKSKNDNILPLTNMYAACDTLLEIISLRIALIDYGKLFRILLAHKTNPEDIAVTIELAEMALKMSQIRACTSTENFNTIFLGAKTLLSRLVEWVLVGSDRTFKQKHSRPIKRCVDEIAQIFDKHLPEESRGGESKEQVDRLLALMAQDDSELLNVFRALRDKGVIAPEFLLKKAKMAKSSEIVKEKEKLTFSSYFQNFDSDDKEEEAVKTRKADPDSGKVKVSAEEKAKLLSRVGRVISRRRTKLCEKFALDNKMAVPAWPKEESESEGRASGESGDGEETSSSGDEVAQKQAGAEAKSGERKKSWPKKSIKK